MESTIFIYLSKVLLHIKFKCQIECLEFSDFGEIEINGTSWQKRIVINNSERCLSVG